MKLIAEIDIFKSETDVEAVGKQDLCNWNSQNKLKVYAIFKSRWATKCNEHDHRVCASLSATKWGQ